MIPTAMLLALLLADDRVDFNRDVRPLLSEKCFACHGADEHARKGKLRLDAFAAATAPAESGAAAVVPGKPDASEMLRRVALPEDDGERMPPLKAGAGLKPAEAALLKRWIAAGAEYQEHWAFVKPAVPALPAVKNAAWARNPVDRFILARLEKEGLAPAPEADRRTLARRWALDLIGLPPTPQQVAEFLADARPGAEERYVDRLLADPAFGERWARVWMDLARYADSAGYGSDPLRPDLHRFRDWTIDAFNRNEPFDRFSIKQLAGDLLPNPTDDDRLATAFHRNTMTNTEGGTDDEEFRTAAVKDRTAVTMQVWMGLTAACAQCHSHKFDPLSQREFYQLFAYFNQTADNDQPNEAPTLPIPTAAERQRQTELDRQVTALRQRLDQPSPGQAERQAAWEKSFGAGELAWRPLAVASATADSGAKAELLPDGGVRFLAPAPKKPEGYTVSLRGPALGLTAVKLETVPDPLLPNGGAGRGAEGNFVLSKLAVELLPTAAAPRAARYVRIELPGPGKHLQLAEVQVFQGTANLARKGQATQSSTYLDAAAARAIDGNHGGDYHQGSVAHTASQADPWWEVDLGAERPLDRIAVWNRTDGGAGSRLAGYRVRALDAQRRTVWRTEPPGVPAPKAVFDLDGPRPVRIAAAWADHEQTNFPVASLVRGDAGTTSGWAIAPHFKAPHHAVFAFAAPLDAEGTLRLRLETRYQDPQWALGRFRLLGTTDPNIDRRLALPSAVAAALGRPAAQRSVADRAALEQHFRVQVEGQALSAEIAALGASRPKPVQVPVLAELPQGQRRVTRLLEKGSFLAPGAVVEALPPTAFGPWPAGAPANRLGLAQWLFAPGNPLTGRVAANRWWARIFGAGLVVTEEDFGTQGEPPSHPELLDWLAAEYRRTGWDTKAFLKLLVLSATYRQSSAASPALLSLDPRNRLLARAPRPRLEAEAVRDQALALSGLLERKIGGPSVFPFQPPNLWQAAFNGQRSWTTSPGADRHRRGLYTFWRRTVPYPSMATFDAPSRETCTLRRGATNTPLQALVTLNDPVYVECAQALSRRLLKEGGATPAARIAFGLELCAVRTPTAAQVARLEKLFAEELVRYRADPAAAKLLAGDIPPGADAAELAAWTVVANVLLNLDAVLTKG